MAIKFTADQVLAAIPKLQGVQADVIESIVEGVDPALPPPPEQVALDIADLLWDLHLHGESIADLVPASNEWIDEPLVLASLPGVVAHRLREYTDLTWSSIVALRPIEIMSWRNTGERKAKALLGYVLERALLSAATVHSLTPSGQPIESHGQDIAAIRKAAIDALAVVGAWAAAQETPRGLLQLISDLESLDDVPADALAVLRGLPVDVFTEDVHRVRFDPDAAADHLLSRFDARELDILTRVLAVDPEDKRTLEEIGDVHGVTRERIRQIESKARQKLEQFVHLPEVRAFTDRAQDLRRRVGRAAPVSAVPSELQPASDSLRDELYAWVAGPYRLEDGWLVSEDVAKPLARWVSRILGEISPDGDPVDRDALADALNSEGLDATHQDDLIALSAGVRVLDDKVVSWGGSIGDKAETILKVRGLPMDIDELAEVIGEGHSSGTLRNALTESRFTRRTKSSYGLAAWGGEEYTNIVSLMRREIEGAGGSISLQTLREDLADRFGISNNSPFLLAHTSSLFITQDGSVRLRRADEPYVPVGSLELTARCFVVDGAWAWMLPVNHDVLRGSGFSIPETFAVHLGLQPGDHGSMQTENGTIRVAWGNQNPYIGSLRRLVEELDGGEGDLLFVRRTTPTALDFRLVRLDDLEYARPRSELLLRVGADPSTQDEIAAVGAAIGLGGAVRPHANTLRARLLERREPSLAELLAKVTDTTAVSEDRSRIPPRTRALKQRKGRTD